MLVSEFMLQQTRVETVIPYYRAFLERYPDAAALAAAAEEDVLTAWAGLGYYARARNLRRAASLLAERLHRGLDEIRQLPGVGPYTAAALASICQGEAHAAVDGNVLRVISRLTNDASEISAGPVRKRFGETAQQLLDADRPGDFNQAMMELGATVCTPARPDCPRCPVEGLCAARAAGTERTLPVKLGKVPARRVELELLVCQVDDCVFLVKRGMAEDRLAGFWELPEKSSGGRLASRVAAGFTHQIVNDRFEVRVWLASPKRRPATLPPGNWFTPEELPRIPLATTARKALAAIAATPLLLGAS